MAITYKRPKKTLQKAKNEREINVFNISKINK